MTIMGFTSYLFVLALVMLMHHLAPSNATKFTIGPMREECFYEYVPAGATVVAQYQVVRGGARDVDVTIWGPLSELLHKKERAHNDQVALVPLTTGEYKFCFSNRMSTFIEKTMVAFITVNSVVVSKEPMDPLEHAVFRLRESVKALRDGQVEYLGRESIERDRKCTPPVMGPLSRRKYVRVGVDVGHMGSDLDSVSRLVADIPTESHLRRKQDQ